MGRLCLALVILALATGMIFADSSILTIEGLFEEALSVSVSMLETLPKETVDVVAVNSAGEETPFTAAGALFSDLLAQYDQEQDHVLSMRLVAGDGYSIDVPAEVLASRQIILAYQIDGMPLGEDSAPLRVIIPGERAMYWVRNLSKIEVLDRVPNAEGE